MEEEGVAVIVTVTVLVAVMLAEGVIVELEALARCELIYTVDLFKPVRINAAAINEPIMDASQTPGYGTCGLPFSTIETHLTLGISPFHALNSTGMQHIPCSH